MKTIFLMIAMLCALPVLATDYYVVEIDPETQQAVSSYGPVTNMPDRVEFGTGTVRVSVTKEEFEEDAKIHDPHKPKIPQAKIDAALADAVITTNLWSDVKLEMHRITKEQNKASLSAETP